MARGRQMPRIVEPGYRGKIGEPKPATDLTGLRIPGARYRPPQALPPRRDPLFDADTAWPHVPDPYEVDRHYKILDRPSYLAPVQYEPDEADWDYGSAPAAPFFDGKALNIFDEGPVRETERLSRADVQELLRSEWELGVAIAHNTAENELAMSSAHDSLQAELAAADAELAAELEHRLASHDPWFNLGVPEPATQDAGGLDDQLLGAHADEAFESLPSDGASGPDAEANALEHEFNRQLDEVASAYGPPADFAEPLPDPGRLNPLDVPPLGRGPGMRLF